MSRASGWAVWVVGAWGVACATGTRIDSESRPDGDASMMGGGGSGATSQGGASGTGAVGAGATSTAGGAAGASGAAGGPPGGGSSGTGGGGGGGAGGAESDAGTPVRDASLGDAAGGDGSAGLVCNGILGLACPLGIVVGTSTASSPALGGTGGSPFDRSCGPGQVLTGTDIRFSTGGSGEIRQLRPECSTLGLVLDADAGGVLVQTSNPQLLSITGDDSSGSYEADRCPTGSVVLGLVARVATDEVRRFGFLCGAITVGPNASGDRWEITVGPATEASPERGRDPGPVTTRWTCPTGTAATSFIGRSGNRIDQVQLRCSPIDVTVPCGDEDAATCLADVAAVPITSRMLVDEDGTATLSCPSGAISGFTSTYGAGCGGTCPVDCGACTLGATSCSLTYDNATCGDCSQGCGKPGDLRITCE